MLPRDGNSQNGGIMLPSDQGLPPEAYALLAQANLLRMRGNWAVAIEKCMEALQIAPENASAQSLLGDIYENQGRLDDAIQWYRMALDVQPDSPADKLKLGHLLTLKAQSLAPSVPPEPPAPKSPPAAVVVPLWDALAGYFGLDPDKMLRRAAFIAGSLALLIVFLAMAVTRRHQDRAILVNQSARQVNAPTVVVPTVNAIPDADPSEAAVDADPAEQTLQSALQSAPGLAGTGMTVAGVQNDPRNQRLTVTTVYQPAPGTAVQRAAVLAGCLRVLQSASQMADVQTYSHLTVRCLLASYEGGSTPLVFIADAERGSLSALNPNPAALTPDQLRDAFSNPWWSLAVPR